MQALCRLAFVRKRFVFFERTFLWRACVRASSQPKAKLTDSFPLRSPLVLLIDRHNAKVQALSLVLMLITSSCICISSLGIKQLNKEWGCADWLEREKNPPVTTCWGITMGACDCDSNNTHQHYSRSTHQSTFKSWLLFFYGTQHFSWRKEDRKALSGSERSAISFNPTILKQWYFELFSLLYVADEQINNSKYFYCFFCTVRIKLIVYWIEVSRCLKLN